MSVLSSVFGKRKAAPPLEVPCPHTALVPRWTQAGDMGKAELVSGYLCTSCSTFFNREEAKPYLG